MRLITFALMTSTPVLARQTNSSRPSRSSLAAFNISANVRFPDGYNDDVHVKQPLGNLETTLGEERMRPPLPHPMSLGNDMQKAVSQLVTAMHGENLKELSRAYKGAARSLESYVIMAYLETVFPAPLPGQHHDENLYKNKMFYTLKKQTGLVMKSLAERDRFLSSVRESVSKRQRIKLTPAMKDYLSQFQDTPGKLFRELNIAGGEEWNQGTRMGNPFASPYLGALDIYRQTYNKKCKKDMSLLDVFIDGYEDEAKVVRMLALVRLSRIYSGEAQKMEEELFTKWLESGKTIGEVVKILRTKAGIPFMAYAVQGPLKRYILHLNTKYPETKECTAKILSLLEGDFDGQAMLNEVKKVKKVSKETKASLEVKKVSKETNAPLKVKKVSKETDASLKLTEEDIRNALVLFAHD